MPVTSGTLANSPLKFSSCLVNWTAELEIDVLVRRHISDKNRYLAHKLAFSKDDQCLRYHLA